MEMSMLSETPSAEILSRKYDILLKRSFKNFENICLAT